MNMQMKRITTRKPPKQIVSQQRPKPLFKPLDRPLQIIGDSASDLEFSKNMDSPKPQDLLISQFIGSLAMAQEGLMLPISGFTTQIESENTSALNQDVESERLQKQNYLRMQSQKLVSDILTADIEINQLIGRVEGLKQFYTFLFCRCANFQFNAFSTSISIME